MTLKWEAGERKAVPIMNSPKISPDTKISANPGVELRDLGNVAVLVLNSGEEQFGLSSIGRSIWLLLPEVRTVRELVVRLGSEFDVSEEQCTQDVIEFIEGLAAGGLLRVSS